MSSGFRLGKHKLGHPAHPDVKISAPADGEVLTYEALTALWKNKSPPAGGAIAYQNVKGTTSVSTTSTTYEDMPQMTLTVEQTGTYLIMFNALIYGLKGSPYELGWMIQILIGTTALPRHFTYCAGNAGFYVVEAFMTVRALNAGDVVKVRWRVYASGNTIIDSDITRELTILKIG